jgi:AcrR family transcriptional regulator
VSTTQTDTRVAGRPRDPHADQAILAATIDLLAEEGFDRLSIEGVAARARVGKTTVYRRWPSKIPLVVDALSAMKAPAVPDVSEDLPTDDALVQVITPPTKTRADRSERVLAGLVDAMSRDAELANAVRTGMVSERRRVLTGIVERGIARGEIRPEVDVGLLVDVLVGAIVLRRLITGGKVDARVARGIVELVCRGAATQEEAPSS